MTHLSKEVISNDIPLALLEQNKFNLIKYKRKILYPNKDMKGIIIGSWQNFAAARIIRQRNARGHQRRQREQIEYYTILLVQCPTPNQLLRGTMPLLLHKQVKNRTIWTHPPEFLDQITVTYVKRNR